MGHTLHITQTQGQDRLGAVQGLNLALLIHTQDHGLVRRVEIEPDDIPHFLHKEGVGGKLEMFPSPRLPPLSPCRRPRGRVCQVWLPQSRCHPSPATRPVGKPHPDPPWPCGSYDPWSTPFCSRGSSKVVAATTWRRRFFGVPSKRSSRTTFSTGFWSYGKWCPR